MSRPGPSSPHSTHWVALHRRLRFLNPPPLSIRDCTAPSMRFGSVLKPRTRRFSHPRVAHTSGLQVSFTTPGSRVFVVVVVSATSVLAFEFGKACHTVDALLNRGRSYRKRTSIPNLKHPTGS